MAIPDYQSIMLPLLDLTSDGKEHTLQYAVEALSKHFGLSDEEMRQTLQSGTPIFASRVGWAKTYLKQAGLLAQPRRGVFVITDRGRDLLKQNLQSINVQLLKQYPEFCAFQNRSKKQVNASVTLSTSENDERETPEDRLARAYGELRAQLAQELLETVKRASPSFFERLVVDLLVKMGYGGNRDEAGKAIGRSGDEGIDGMINEDKLGLDVIYIQAKRWEGIVGRPEIQKFAGALMGQRAAKGVFITTSGFSQGARQYAESIDKRIILIDGEMLASLMIDAGVGVTPREVFEIKRIDLDYFEE